MTKTVTKSDTKESLFKMSKNLNQLIEDSAELLKMTLKILLLPDEENEPSGTRNPDENENNERPF